jgi:glyoxylase-like metal-dependent hydrolase (beta-lactamase superfamily II)
MDRRTFLALSAGGTAASLTLTPLRAAGDLTQVIGVYRRGAGEVVVTALLDGSLEIDPAMLNGADEETKASLLREAFLGAGPVDTSINAFVIHAPDRTVLVDGGAGAAMGAGAGRVPLALASAGLSMADVDAIFATHLHPDHIGAFVRGGEAAAPQAEMILHSAERDFWSDESNFADAGEQMQAFAAMAREAIAPYSERLRTIGDGAEIASGVTAMHLPGHTPGHTGLMIDSGGRQLLIWADIVHVGPIQFARPGVTIPFDVDEAQAAETRRAIMDRAATDRLEIAGSHVDYPGFGHLERAGEGYRLIPSRWDHAL